MVYNTWTTKTSMPSPRDIVHVASIEARSKIYVPGGSNAGTYKNTFYEYDIATNTWSSKATMPASLAGAATVAVGDIVYVAGGVISGTGTYQNTLYAWDYNTNTWTTLANMPAARYDANLVAIGNKLYNVSGSLSTGGGGSDTLFEYDIATDTWATKAAMQEIQQHFAAVVIGTKIYVFAGYHSGQNEVYIWDQSTNTWSYGTNRPVANMGIKAGVSEGKAIVLSGSTGPYCHEYDPDTDTWTAKTNVPASLRYMGAVGCQGKIYCVGGRTNSGATTVDTVYEWDGVQNVAPDIPTNLAVTSTSLDTTPNFSADISDDNTDQQIKARFEIETAAGTSVGSVDSTLTTGAHTATAEYASALALGEYRVRAKTIDDAGEESSYADYVYFSVRQAVVAPDLELLWQVGVLVGPDLELLWDVFLTGRKDLELIWNTAEFVSTDLELLWSQKTPWDRVTNQESIWVKVDD